MKKVLVANRGEIALRIMKTLRKMDITSVAVYSDVDADAPFVKYADEAYCLGEATPSESYLNMDKVLREFILLTDFYLKIQYLLSACMTLELSLSVPQLRP